MYDFKHAFFNFIDSQYDKLIILCQFYSVFCTQTYIIRA